MENQKVKTILKSVAIILILFAIAFALRAQAADIHGIPNVEDFIWKIRK